MLLCCFCFIFYLVILVIDGFQWLGLESHKTFLTVQKKPNKKKRSMRGSYWPRVLPCLLNKRSNLDNANSTVSTGGLLTQHHHSHHPSKPCVQCLVLALLSFKVHLLCVRKRESSTTVSTKDLFGVGTTKARRPGQQKRG